MLDAGEDPSNVKREKKRQTIEKSEQTFERVAREWHKKGSAKWSAGYAAKIMDNQFDRHAMRSRLLPTTL